MFLHTPSNCRLDTTPPWLPNPAHANIYQKNRGSFCSLKIDINLISRVNLYLKIQLTFFSKLLEYFNDNFVSDLLYFILCIDSVLWCFNTVFFSFSFITSHFWGFNQPLTSQRERKLRGLHPYQRVICIFHTPLSTHSKKLLHENSNTDMKCYVST